MIEFEVKTVDGHIYTFGSKVASFTHILVMIRESKGFFILNGNKENKGFFVPFSAMVYIKEL